MDIKICGITNVDDGRVAAEAGADMFGFIFVERSPRYLSPDDARQLIQALPKQPLKVGVFVDRSTDEMLRVAEHCQLDVLQLHGDESPEQAARLCELGHRVIKALALHQPSDLKHLADFPGCQLLIDSCIGDSAGSGETGDWALASQAASQYDIILAGGLDVDNVAHAVTTVRPAGIDVSTGVEHSKRRKSHHKLQTFMRAARGAEQKVRLEDL